MKNKRIKLYLKKEMDFIEKYAQIILLSTDPEAIHQLRVGYKKLRAFLRLVKLASSAEKGFAIPSTLRAIYRCAGRVRDLQIYFYKISSFYNKSDSYPRLVLHQIAEARYMLLMVLKTFHFDVALRKLKKEAPNHLSRKTLEKFIKKRSKEIERLLETKMQDDRLHALKKYLKDVSYSLDAFHGRARDYYRTNGGVANKRELVALTDAVNDYLDWVVGLAILKISLSGKLSTDDKKKLRQIRKKWSNKKLVAKRRVIALIHS